jgi:HJR/Mrr/RecB family endonuclease
MRRQGAEYIPLSCPACQTKLITKETGKRWVTDQWSFRADCPLCAWQLITDWARHMDWCAGDTAATESSLCVSILKELTVELARTAISELGAHLRKNFSDIYNLDWRCFEELICDVFRAYGFDAVLTQPSADGGADVLLFKHQTTGLYAIVECKKYRPDRKIGVEAVRALVGAAVQWNVRRAYLVTTSDFTSVARMAAGLYAQHGYEIDLYAAADLLQLLGVYNDRLPPIWNITENFRAELTRINSRIIGRLQM